MFAALTIAAVGIVVGDIGTSPDYYQIPSYRVIELGTQVEI